MFVLRDHLELPPLAEAQGGKEERKWNIWSNFFSPRFLMLHSGSVKREGEGRESDRWAPAHWLDDHVDLVFGRSLRLISRKKKGGGGGGTGAPPECVFPISVLFLRTPRLGIEKKKKGGRGEAVVAQLDPSQVEPSFIPCDGQGGGKGGGGGGRAMVKKNNKIQKRARKGEKEKGVDKGSAIPPIFSPFSSAFLPRKSCRRRGKATRLRDHFVVLYFVVFPFSKTLVEAKIKRGGGGKKSTVPPEAPFAPSAPFPKFSLGCRPGRKGRKKNTDCRPPPPPPKKKKKKKKNPLRTSCSRLEGKEGCS